VVEVAEATVLVVERNVVVGDRTTVGVGHHARVQRAGDRRDVVEAPQGRGAGVRPAVAGDPRVHGVVGRGDSATSGRGRQGDEGGHERHHEDGEETAQHSGYLLCEHLGRCGCGNIFTYLSNFVG